MPATCHGVIASGALLKLCALCAKHSTHATEPTTGQIVPIARRAGPSAWRCANHVSLPGSGQDFAPAGVATLAGAFSSEG